MSHQESIFEAQFRGLKEIIVDLRKTLQQEREERQLLYEIIKDLGLQLKVLKSLDKRLETRLSFIKIAIGGTMPVGPATLTVGDKKTVSVLGFDQNGAPFTIDFTANPVAFTDDNQAVVADTPGSTVTDPISCLAVGVANMGATCAGFSDTEAVTVLAAAPVLSSIKISID